MNNKGNMETPSSFNWFEFRSYSGYGTHKRGLNKKLHLAVDATGKSVRAQLTAGTVADCSQAISLLEGLEVKVPLADKGYDTNAILDYTQKHGITAVISPKRNQTVQREYDKELYKRDIWLKMPFFI